jgi:Family of unknown function (DUF6325)
MTQASPDVGPIDYVVVEFPGAKFTGEVLAELVKLTEQGIIRVLDLRVAVVEEGGGFTAIAITDIDGDGELDLAVFEGVESGLLGDDDLAESAALVGAGDAVAVLVYENTWAGPFVSAVRHQGGDVIASGRIPADEVIAALDSMEES